MSTAQRHPLGQESWRQPSMFSGIVLRRIVVVDGGAPGWGGS